MDLRDRPDVAWNGLFGISIAAIAALSWFLFAPHPTSRRLTSKDDLQTQQATVNRHGQSEADDRSQVEALAWASPADSLGPAVLDRLTALSIRHSVQLTSFRTDRSSVVAGLEEAPFAISVEGSFPDVLAFVNSVEDPSSKLAVNLVELSASDTAPGRVTASFGLLGFLLKETK